MQDVARIAAVAVVGPSKLDVTWSDGTASTIDLAGWIARGSARIAPLKDSSVFARAELGLYGGNVTWDGDEGDLAIDSEHLRMIGEHQAPFDAAAISAWQADMGVSNAEAADLVDVVPSTWFAYKAGTRVIPPTVARLCRAIRNDPVMLSAHLRPRVQGRPKGTGAGQTL
ncbi:DUF2442 domain-containing protein [Salmonella enterica]|nr:DUF2442 domain-containing protein [Salmonella enterica]